MLKLPAPRLARAGAQGGFVGWGRSCGRRAANAVVLLAVSSLLSADTGCAKRDNAGLEGLKWSQLEIQPRAFTSGLRKRL